MKKNDSETHYGLEVETMQNLKYAIAKNEAEANGAALRFIEKNPVYVSPIYISEATGTDFDEVVRIVKGGKDANENCLKLIENTCGWTRFLSHALEHFHRGDMAMVDSIERKTPEGGFLYRIG